MNRFSNHAFELPLVSIPNVTHPSPHRALVAPLFGLFFMAIFVPWATATGTIVGAVCVTGCGAVACADWRGPTFRRLTTQMG